MSLRGARQALFKCDGGCGEIFPDELMWRVTRKPNAEPVSVDVSTMSGATETITVNGPEELRFCVTCFKVALQFLYQLREQRTSR